MVNKLMAFTSIFVILLMTSFVFAQNDLSQELEDFVKKVAEKKGIDRKNIENITEVNISQLPEEVKLENIDDSNIALYKVKPKNDRSAFVITFSGKGLEKIPKPEIDHMTSYLHFGYDGDGSKSLSLKTASGVSTGLNKGYVMMREGSITGISTNLEIVQSDTDKEIQIIIYKNGREIHFKNSIPADSSGIEKDFDIQSQNIVTFKPGDVISVYLKSNGEIVFRDVITIIEISTKVQ